jgi:hypothetical protein
MRSYLAALACALLPSAVAAQEPAPTTAQGDVAVTIYSNGVALVQDRRTLSLPRGRSRQEFPDVSNNIRPATVRLSADGVTIIEQNYDYDLLSPTALMAKAVGQTVTLIRTNPATGAETREQATVLANNGGVVLRIGERIEVLRDDGLPVRVVFPTLPPNLRARPTLSITMDAAASGSRPVTLSYLTSGMSWTADYVALFDEAKSQLDVQGWITLSNGGETPFVNADTVLVAGAPGGEEGRVRPRGYDREDQIGTETAARGRLGDFYLYPLGARTTIAANQQKQVSFLSAGGVAARKLYRFRNEWLNSDEEARSVDTVLGFANSSRGGLGDALPAGTVRVYLRDQSGQPQFVGEDRIDHTPQGSTLSLKTGEAFDVKVRPIVDKREKIVAEEWEKSAGFRVSVDGGPYRTIRYQDQVTYYRTRMRYVLSNARPQPVEVEVTQGGLARGYGDTRVPEESVPGRQRSLDERVWRVTVPANGETTLTATIDTRY